MSQLIYKNGCWDCKKAIEDPQQEYVCSKSEQHFKEYHEQRTKE